MAKITWADKIALQITGLAHVNVWKDADANELKDESDSQDDRLLALEQGLINEVIDVSAVWTSAFSFDVSADNYPVNNIYYSSTATTVTLDGSDGALDRIDLIVAVAPIAPATVGTVDKITGTPAATPSPPDYDPTLVFPIKFVIVEAASSKPTPSANELIYDENVGPAVEWTATDNTAN